MVPAASPTSLKNQVGRLFLQLPLSLLPSPSHIRVSNYSVCFPGDYEVSIKFNNEHVPDSPFIVPIATLSDEARRLTLTSLQVDIGLQIHVNVTHR